MDFCRLCSAIALKGNISGTDLGEIQFFIDGNWYPRKSPSNYYNLGLVFDHLKRSFKNPYYPGGSDGKDFGDKQFDTDLFNELLLPNIFVIETSELTGIVPLDQSSGCLELLLGYNGAFERVFYSFDLGNSFKELVLPRNTLYNLIQQLPDSFE